MTTFSAQQPGYWNEFPDTYRTEQVVTIARWLAAGESGVIVGRSGAGKSNLAGFLATRPEITCAHLGVPPDRYVFLHLDINSLPVVTTGNFYRTLLYTLQSAAGQLGTEFQQRVDQVMARLPNTEDGLALFFILQQVHDLFINQAGKQIVWLIDRFDAACQKLEVGVLSSLRHLRDNNRLRGKLAYLLFTRHPLARLRNPAEFDEFHEIVVANTCWVGPMVERDCQWIARQMAERHHTSFAPADVVQLITVTGGLPAFLKAACTALAGGQLTTGDPPEQWTIQLLAQPLFRRNCQELWQDCSAAERTVLSSLAVWGDPQGLDAVTVGELANNGLLHPQPGIAHLQIFSPLFATFVKEQQPQRKVGVTMDTKTGAVVRDGKLLTEELTPLEHRLLGYFLQHPGETCEKNSLIAHIWPDEKVEQGIRDDSLAQLVKRLRDKIEAGPGQHTYIQTVRGWGYRFVQPEP